LNPAGRPRTAATLAGTLLVAAGAMLLAIKGVITKFIYARGMDYEGLVVIRSVLAVPLFWAWALRYGAASAIVRAPARAVAAAAFAGALCYSLGSLLDFYALTLIDASLERALLFTYPAMVVIAGAVLARRLPAPRVSGAITLTWVGVALAVGAFDRDVLSANVTGAVCVLLCAGTFATYFLISERYTRQVGSLAFTVFAMTGAAVALVLWHVPRHWSWPVAPDAASWVLIALLVVFSTVAPVLMLAEGVRRIGAERGAIVSTVGPPFTILVAWLAIDERLSLHQLAGTALIVGGILFVELARRRRPASA
jgi:drug/metabolite transporter (DMT)-like permease